MMTMDELERVESLRAGWAAYQQANKRAFKYDAAAHLGVTEAQLVAMDCGQGTTRLKGDWKQFLAEFPQLGEVMTLTRNHWAVHEKTGNYAPVSFNGHVGLVLDPNVDLRIFIGQWAKAFAVVNLAAKAYKRSFQFFDSAGNAVHKVFVGDDAADAFDALTAAYASEDQRGCEDVKPARAAAPERPDADIDVEGMRATWDALQDTHDFYPLLRRYEVSRTQCFRLAGAPRAERLHGDAWKTVLTEAAARELPIMVFVGNPGCIQIHTGVVRRVVPMEGWFNIMDPHFNLHVREAGIAEVWLTRKPTRDGVVTGVELFDAEGHEIAILFGKRKPGIPELPEWRALAEDLPRV